MINRPAVIEIDSNEFDSFLGKKARARRQARKAEKTGTTSYKPVDPLIAGALPAETGKKPKPTDTFGVPKPSEKETTTEMTKTADAGSEDTTNESFFSKHRNHLIIGAVVVFAGYWFFLRKKK